MPTRVTCIALDYGGTLTNPQDDVQAHIGMRPVTPAAARVIQTLHRRGLRLVLASNTDLTRRWALERAGVANLFAGLVESYTLGHAKPAPEFYAAVLHAAGAPPERVLFVGNDPEHDVRAPLAAGMQAAFVGPFEQTRDLPREAYHLLNLAHLPEVVDELRGGGETTCTSC